jgi:hypothetical protein
MLSETLLLYTNPRPASLDEITGSLGSIQSGNIYGASVGPSAIPKTAPGHGRFSSHGLQSCAKTYDALYSDKLSGRRVGKIITGSKMNPCELFRNPAMNLSAKNIRTKIT